MKKSELSYLVESFENAPTFIKENIWWWLIREWLSQIEIKKGKGNKDNA